MARPPVTRHLIMFVVGIAIAVSTAGLMVFTDIEAGSLSAFDVIGLVMIAVGRRRMRAQ